MPLLLPRTTEQGAQLDEDEKEEEGEKDEEEGEESEGGAERGWRDGGGERMGEKIFFFNCRFFNITSQLT